MAFRIRTIQDLERVYYGRDFDFFQKADAPVLSTTTGVYNAIFGAQVWAQINQEANAWGLLPKVPWVRSGWRVLTVRAGSTADGGVAENAAIPDTIKPTFQEISTKPKTVAHTFDVSEIQDFLATSGDDAIGDMQFMRTVMGAKHREAMNQQLLVDFDTAAGDGLESLDRVAASDNEETSLSYTAGDADIYGIDRSANSWSDAQISHASGTDRVLTDKLIRTMLNDIKNNGGNTTLILTGNDTMTSIQGLYDSQVQYNPLGETTVKIGVNGVETEEGIGVGITVATLYRIPLFTSKDVQKDTISRIYFLDTSDPEGFGVPRLRIEIAKPTQYFEAGMNTNDPFGINRLGNEGMYRTMGELKCSFFAAQGKIRDLK